GEDRTPKLVEPNRNNEGAGMSRDQFVAPLQTQQYATAFELAFRKKTDDFTRGDFVGGRANRGPRLANVDRNAADDTQKPMQRRLIIKLLVNDVANRPRTSGLQHDGVHPGDVVGQKEKSASGQRIEAECGDSVSSADKR